MKKTISLILCSSEFHVLKDLCTLCTFGNVLTLSLGVKVSAAVGRRPHPRGGVSFGGPGFPV